MGTVGLVNIELSIYVEEVPRILGRLLELCFAMCRMAAFCLGFSDNSHDAGVPLTDRPMPMLPVLRWNRPP